MNEARCPSCNRTVPVSRRQGELVFSTHRIRPDVGDRCEASGWLVERGERVKDKPSNLEQGLKAFDELAKRSARVKAERAEATGRWW
jgi:hypothetical protein